MKKMTAIIMILVSIALFASVVRSTHEKIGQPFPGYLTFENGVVGAFYVADWPGYQHGLRYHSIPNEAASSTQTFTDRDFFLTSFIPALSGLLFVLLGIALTFYISESSGRWPLLLFHFLVGNYILLTPDFHLTYHFTYLLLIIFALIPAPMIHFAQLFPEIKSSSKTRWWISYVVSILFIIPYTAFFFHPHVWIKIEYVVFFYLVFSYLYWIRRLLQVLQKPQLDYNRLVAKYILVGQLIAFSVPLISALLIFLFNYPFPMNVATPFALLFPIALFMGVILGRLRQSQMQLVQSEKSAALGNLLAGLAHEINNPMTFIYAAIEPMKESIQKLKMGDGKSIQDMEELLGAMEEGATRAKNIVESFRYFSYPQTKISEEFNLHEVMDRSIQLLQPQWVHRIEIRRHYGDIHTIKGSVTEMGQVFINILSNACYAIANQGTIDIYTTEHQGEVEVRIRDSGLGISKDVMAKIFDPFYTTKKQGEGTGLGLAISLQMIRKMGGDIIVQSEKGKGSEFILKLPGRS